MRSAGGPGDEGKGRRYKIARVLESLLRLLLQNAPREGRVGVAETKVFIVSRYKRERGEQLRVSPYLRCSPQIPSGRAAEPALSSAPRLRGTHSGTPRAAVGLHRTVMSPTAG